MARKKMNGVLDVLKYVGAMSLMLGAMWGLVYWLAVAVKDYEVIEPEEGVRCVVVSRMMMTSVSCWKVDE